LLAGGLLLFGCGPQGRPLATPQDTALPAQTPATIAAATGRIVTTPTEIPPPGPPARADLAIEIPERLALVPGETTVYTLSLRNHGPDLATEIVLTGVLPSGVATRWAQPAQAACRQIEAGVDCDLGDLIAGGAVTVTLDLAGAGAGPAMRATHGDGAEQQLPWLTCAVDQGAVPSLFTCQLDSLQPGAETWVRVGLAAGNTLTGTRVHTVTMTANEIDPRERGGAVTASIVPGPGRVAEASPPDLVVQGEGPTSVTTGQPFTYTYTITNRGGLDATGVWFYDEIPSDTDLVGYAPRLPRCAQQGDAVTCQLHVPGRSEGVTFTLVVTGHGEQPLALELDPLLPGWPACFVIKEQTWQHIVYCEIGVLRPGEATRVELELVAIGSRARTTANTASVRAAGQDLNPLDNSSTTTITVQAGGAEQAP
jgi:uncharacterized repeat protein (TIGR01451 family)